MSRRWCQVGYPAIAGAAEKVPTFVHIWTLKQVLSRKQNDYKWLVFYSDVTRAIETKALLTSAVSHHASLLTYTVTFNPGMPCCNW